MLRIMFKLFFAGVLALGCLAGPSIAQVPTAQPVQQYTPLTLQSVPQMLQSAGFQPMVTFNAQNNLPVWSFMHPQSGKKIALAADKLQGNQIFGFAVACEVPMPLGGVNPQLLNQVNSKLNPYILVPIQGNKLALARPYNLNDSNPQELLAIVTDLVAKASQAQQLLNGQPPVAPAPAPTPAPVPAPVPVPAPGQVVNLAGTTWNGQHNLSGTWTGITFQFQAGNQATVVIATPKGPMSIQASYVQNGNQVTVTTPNETFTGTISGTTFAGQGQDNIGPWNFTTNKVN
jgi:hypothetical protein